MVMLLSLCANARPMLGAGRSCVYHCRLLGRMAIVPKTSTTVFASCTMTMPYSPAILQVLGSVAVFYGQGRFLIAGHGTAPDSSHSGAVVVSIAHRRLLDRFHRIHVARFHSQQLQPVSRRVRLRCRCDIS